MTTLVDSSPIAEHGSYYSAKATELKSQYNLKVLSIFWFFQFCI